MRTKTAGVYSIKCLPTGKVYIGSSRDITKRWERHRGELRQGKHHSDHLQRSWDKHGEAAFQFDVVEIVADPKQRIPREQFWMDHYQAYQPDHGYNCNPKAGSNLGRTFSEQARRNMAAAHRGKKASKATRALMSEQRRGARSHRARLTRAQVLHIRQRLLAGDGLDALASEFGVARTTIHAIRSGETWSHLGPPIPPPSVSGSARWGSKLDEAAVRAIREELRSGTTVAELAHRHGVSRATLNDLRAGRTWKHVLEDANECSNGSPERQDHPGSG